MFLRLISFALLCALQSHSAAIRCESVYQLTQKEYIEHSHLDELVLATEDNQYLGLSIENFTFKLKTFKSWDAVKAFYKSVPMSERKMLTELIQQRKLSLSDTIGQVLNLSIAPQGQITYRFKDATSLKLKIFDRLKKFTSDKKNYKLIDLSDVLGFRITLNPQSNMLRHTGKEDWAEWLGINLKNIYELEIKGTDQDIAAGKYYRALHFNIIGKDSTNFEVQVMSESMAVWHRWDHKNVYKNSDKASAEFNKLKKYSEFWGQLIYSLSKGPAKTKTDFANAVRQHCVDWGLPIASTIAELNTAITKKSQLNPELGFSFEELQQLDQIYSF